MSSKAAECTENINQVWTIPVTDLRQPLNVRLRTFNVLLRVDQALQICKVRRKLSAHLDGWRHVKMSRNWSRHTQGGDACSIFKSVGQWVARWRPSCLFSFLTVYNMATAGRIRLYGAQSCAQDVWKYGTLTDIPCRPGFVCRTVGRYNRSSALQVYSPCAFDGRFVKGQLGFVDVNLQRRMLVRVSIICIDYVEVDIGLSIIGNNWSVIACVASFLVSCNIRPMVTIFGCIMVPTIHRRSLKISK